MKERKRPNEKKYSEVKLMCQAGNLYRHCNVRVDSNFVKLTCVHPEIVDFGSRQGRRIFSTTVVVRLRRGSMKSENAVLGRKMLFLDGH